MIHDVPTGKARTPRASLVVERGTEGVESAISSHVRWHLCSCSARVATAQRGQIGDQRWGPLGAELKSSGTEPTGVGFVSRKSRWVPRFELLICALEILPPKHEHINPPPPPYQVPLAEWPRVVQRMAQGESLRKAREKLPSVV